MGEAQGRRIAAEMLQKEIYLLKLPAIRHGRHHLCQLFLLALQHPVNMLHRNLGVGKYEQNRGMTLGGISKSRVIKKHLQTSCTCDVLQSRSLILSLMSFINDVML